MQSRNHAIMQSRNHAIMQSCNHAIMQSCSHAIMQSCIIALLSITFAFQKTLAQNVSYLTAKPLSSVVKTQLSSVKSTTTLKIPLITWGGDVATILAKTNGIFQKQGLKVSLFREDNFKKQVEMCLRGETPYLRGTMGMINAAANVFKARNSELVVIYQMTWSVGGDAMVVRPGKSLNNIQYVALQLYGPHMDYAANLFKKAGRLSKIKFKWLTELTLPSYDSKGKVVDPVTAFQVDGSIHAVMCIIPDALLLTSNGTVGTGAEGSVKGAKILISTKTAGKIIADVYAVRKDYFDKHKNEVMKFVKALMLGEEALRDLQKNKTSQQYKQLMSKSANIFFGASEAIADAEALLGDCQYVGYSGNVSFFTGKGTLRNFNTLTSEIQNSFISMDLMTSKIQLKAANWDYSKLTVGLKYAAYTIPVKKQFDQQKAATAVERKILVEPTKWEEEGTLFVIEINFEPNQSVFSIQKYANDFQTALEISQTYNGALIIIEGHSDPLGILQAEQKGEKKQIINSMKQQAKNLSLQRAQNVRKNFISYSKKKGILIDESQFIAVGFGTKIPKYNPPKTEQQWKANRRVVFRIKQIEAELDKFVPLK